MVESVTAKCVGRHERVLYACRKGYNKCLLRAYADILQLSAVKGSEAEPESNCCKLPATSPGTKL